ncbi:MULTISPECIES: flavin-containing monooxygenase [Gordonia]|uniref:NAD(P)/FAD-dependent oxidoreductase n=1 Tax=Gordonia amicalis TaxID=89053 RepID=A0ABU4DE21_9ACTN|nr:MULTISPECIES: NAD(P)/FAD-dependent oxidoreductase [Gordonia]ATD69361.1 NAD(P)/FAD-dependent oxidoreductase [Gordonia sp. 1D]MCR8898313.1 NAD(P)/FAD-dependent oxidoreductase [Gordonia sp. GONU]MDJ0451918.1 NAD(P)/FAD-dependent oxidoreductase [Gordonia amicalis]MDV6307973.1 NAD(P)/FAD-dependent oxidoreductase [Gordonia amicalis]MDV7076182.1 NAD(P)/FAD-dependent oxidoreductase [Gordonia amicalis]
MTTHRTSAPHRTSTPRPPWPGPDWSGAPDNSFRPNAEFGDAELEAALEEANLPILLGSLALLTGDDRWIREPFLPTPPPDLGDHDGGGFGPELATRIRQEAHTAMCAWRDGDLMMSDPPAPERLSRILSVMLAEAIPDDYGRLLGEEMGIHRRHSEPSSPPADGFRVAVIGAGISGLAMAIRLEQAGIDYILIDKNTAVGGTWHENVYPGCGVDTPSYLYALSFDPKPDWSSHFAPQHELAEYWQDLAERHGVLARTRFSTMVDSAVFDSGTSTWTLTVRSVHTGETENLTATAVVSAVGLLNQPSFPDLPGLQDFDGPVLHTARWDPEFDLRGKRVAVVGTGASAMQFVPAAADIAAQVRIFQRSPQWAMPHPLKGAAVRASTHWLNEHVPFYLAWYRARLFWRMGDKVWRLLQVDRDYPHLGRAINKGNDRLRAMLTAYIESELSDRPDLLEKSLPDYPPYGKRLLIDAGWFRTLRRDNVDLITTGIETITPSGVATTAGTTFEADVIVLATGFRSVDVLGSVEVRGRDGRTLREVWGDDDGRAHLGITVPGFPNFFCLYGPNTNTGHGGTVIAGTEMQIQHVTALLAAMIDDRLATIEVRPEAYEAYNRELDEALADTVWHFGGTTTYYRNDRGRIVTNSPWRYVDYWRRVHQPDPAHFLTTRDTVTAGLHSAVAEPVAQSG